MRVWKCKSSISPMSLYTPLAAHFQTFCLAFSNITCDLYRLQETEYVSRNFPSSECGADDGEKYQCFSLSAIQMREPGVRVTSVRAALELGITRLGRGCQSASPRSFDHEWVLRCEVAEFKLWTVNFCLCRVDIARIT
jgi:hypothetical protein